ncbi:MarR family transcriptional regulator [Rhodospirillaceae bacterium KN72]|uniref:MarR family transcriptional regulator n=1 Tax=Pacificispira spongiicola TaxID=2729598 RepID=A0A7Y0DWU8_9PROT|nr:MarR family transcriptional regulator [Pacificispira spongiicola]NMM43067.1 MarR family transcriptional regulator [Pacificispira spongiicola]
MTTALQTDRIAFLITKLHRFVHNSLEETLQPHGISVEQWRVLERLSDGNGFSMGELAAEVLMNHPALTKMIDRMVANGLVHRAPDPADQRRVLVYAADRGVALTRKLQPIVAAQEARLRDMLGSDTAEQVEGMLTGASRAIPERV